MFSKHTGIKLETSNKRKFGEFTNMWELNRTLLNPNNQWNKDEIIRKISEYYERKKG